MTGLLLMTTTAAMSDNKNDKEWSDLEMKRAQLLEKGSVEAALAIYDKMAEHAEKQGRIEDAASVRRDKVGLLHNLQQDSLLIEEATRQMAWMEQHGQKEYFYRIWRLMAESYYFSHKPQTALRQAKLMLEYAQEHGDDQGRASAYQQMGFNYLEVDNDEAIKTYQHSIKLFRQMSGDHYGDLNRSYGYLCEALENKKDYANELKYCAEWKKLLDEWGRNAVGKQMNRVYIEQHLQTASALIGLGRIDEAEQELAEVERLNQMEKDDYYSYVILVRRAQAAYLAGHYSQAVAYSDRFAPMMESDDWVLPRLVRAEALIKGNRPAEAAQIYRRLYEAKDSTFSKDMRMQLDELNTLFQVDELKIQNQLVRSRFITGIFACALIGLLLFLYFRHRSAKRLAEMKSAKERIENELSIARDIQMSMVPHQFPNRPGLDLYASMMPAREVGGDLYGYQLYDDRLYFCIGDVSGKGVPASLFMAQATRLFRTLAEQGMMPAEICTHINNALSGEDNEQGMFVTMFLGLVDLKTGHLDFCNAGHNPPVLGGDEHQGSFLEMEPNAPIGLWPGLEFVGESIESIKGRPLFIYTDGLNEAENTRHEQFGDDRLLSSLRDTSYESSRQVIETLAALVEAHHRQGAEPNDDLTMMCLRLS